MSSADEAFGEVWMEVIPVRLASRGFGETTRRDVWWSTPLAIFIGLSAFVGVRDLGGFSERALHLRPVPVAVLRA